MYLHGGDQHVAADLNLSVISGLGCGLGCIPALSVTHSDFEAAYASSVSLYK